MNATSVSKGFVKMCTFIDFEVSDFNNVDYTSTKIIVNHVVFCVVNALLTVSTIGLNSITAMACWKSTQLRKTKAHFMIMVLSLNDLAVGLICSPSYVVIIAREILLRKTQSRTQGILPPLAECRRKWKIKKKMENGKKYENEK